MKERIFALKKGTEVPAQFDGATIPFQVPDGLAEIVRVMGGSEAFVKAVAQVEGSLSATDMAVRNSGVAVFNQAHALNVQKHVKAEAGKEGATIDLLRKAAAEHKYGQVRVKGPGSGSPKTSARAVAGALGDDFLAMLTPEQRKVYDEKMAALAAKKAEAATPATQAPTSAPTEAKGATQGRKK